MGLIKPPIKTPCQGGFVMKALIFDTGPIISLTLTNLLWILKPLRQHFKGSFIIPEAVKFEVIDHPFKTKRFKFEAIQVLKELYEGTFNLVKSEKVKSLAQEFLEVTNHTFKAHGSFIQVVQPGEMEVLAAAKLLGAKAIVVDERTTRMLVEEPHKLKELMQSKLHTKVVVDNEKLNELISLTHDIKVIRSVELATIAYELKILNNYIVKTEERAYKNMKKELLDSVLWGLKLNGCSVSQNEIEDILKMEF